MKKLLVITLLALLVAACMSNNVEPPAKLAPFTPGVRVNRLWSASVGSADSILRLGIVVASDGINVYAAGHDGEVSAFALKNGRRLWRTSTGQAITAGPGVGNGLVVVGTQQGEVLALDAATGKQEWKANVPGMLLASPAANAAAVVVHTTDGHIIGLAPASGKQLWNVTHQVPNLVLRGSGTPVLGPDTAYVGLADGSLQALSLADGSQRWLAVVSAASGSNDLARLAALNGSLALGSNNIYAVTYQGKIAAVGRESGQILWSRDMSSYTGAREDATDIFVSDTHSAVWALSKSTGVPVWTQPQMRARDLTVPVPFGDTVVAGDLQGYLFFLSQKDGSVVARERLGGDPILAPPIVVGDTLVVLSTNGDLAAYRLAPLK
ncbi:MAG: outer membrane protein assembly factor BamB [Gammaproteobacteria bacterium]